MEEMKRPEGAIVRAILAIEKQRVESNNAESSERKQQREKFFRLMNEIRVELFSAITAAATANETSLLPGKVVPDDFNSKVQEIYKQGFGVYPSRDLNEWLYAHDLKHLLHADLLTIHW